MQPSADPTAQQQADPMAVYQQAMQQYMAMQQAQAAGAAATDPAVQAAYAAQLQQQQAAYAAQVAQYQAMMAANQAQQLAQTQAVAQAAPLSNAPLQAVQDKDKHAIDTTDPDKVIGIITKVDDSGDFGFVKFKTSYGGKDNGHVFLHKAHYTSSRHDQELEVGIMIQGKLFNKDGGKQSISQAYEILDPEATQKLKQELKLDVLDNETYTGWVVWIEQSNVRRQAKIRSLGLEEKFPHIDYDVKRGVAIHKERTTGLTLGMCVTFQIELDSQCELLGRNVFVVPETNPDDIPFYIDDGEGFNPNPSANSSKGKGKKGKGKDKGSNKGKGKGVVVPPPMLALPGVAPMQAGIGLIPPGIAGSIPKFGAIPPGPGGTGPQGSDQSSHDNSWSFEPY